MGPFGFSGGSLDNAIFNVPRSGGQLDVEALCGRLVSMLRSTSARVVDCDVSALGAGLDDVEAVARLQLTARRRGAQIVLCGTPDELAGLLACLGLASVFEPLHAEEGEQSRVEERVQRADPPP